MKGVIPFPRHQDAGAGAALLPWGRGCVAPEGLAFEKAAATVFFAGLVGGQTGGRAAFEHLAPAWRPPTWTHSKRFREGLLFDWNNTDWFCVKVLDKLVRHGPEFAQPIAGRTAQVDAPLWQRRAGAVAFVNLAKHGTQPPSSPALWELMWTAARNNVRSPERFMQTSVGWLVRELGRANRDAALAFLAEHRALLGREAARYIVEKLPADAQRAALVG